MSKKSQNLWKTLPDTPGVYVMKNAQGEVLYVGKAGNLKRRVSSYFLRPHEYRLERLAQSIDKIDFYCTDTAIEALILESELIKKLKPPYNVREKDDKSFLYVVFTKEKFPRVLLMRGKEFKEGKSAFLVPSPTERQKNRSAERRERSVRFGAGYGPFTSAANVREALKILRRIFPWSVHPPEKLGTMKRPCLDYELHLCPGTCIGAILQKDYKRNIQNLKSIFEGKKEKILKSLDREMKSAAKAENFEKAAEFRRQIFALNHIKDVSLIHEEGPAFEAAKSRIEGYDISNISGTSSVGSMVVFINGYPDKNEYRKFKIKTLAGANDVGMLKEVLRRRFSHAGETGSWPLPDLILIDGGVGQVHGAKIVLNEIGLNIPVVGIAKGPKRKRNDLIGRKPEGIDMETLIKVRDEAHRFAISYHKNLRGRKFLGTE